MIIPARYIMMASFMYGAVALAVSRTPKRGNRQTGSNDVTERWTTSNIQYTAISRMT